MQASAGNIATQGSWLRLPPILGSQVRKESPSKAASKNCRQMELRVAKHGILFTSATGQRMK